MISQLPGKEGEDGFGSAQGFGSILSPASQIWERVLQVVISCLFICHHQLPLITAATEVWFILCHIYSSPPPLYPLVSSEASVQYQLFPASEKCFTVLKHHFSFFFYYRSLAVLFLSGSHFVVYAIDPFLNSEVCS